MVNIYKIIILKSFLLAIAMNQVVDEKLYITIQMMDQVGIINTETNQIDSIVETEMQSNYQNSCMDYTVEMECSMADGCEWMMGMCMDSSSDVECMDYTVEMECSMADGCEWMMGMCMDSINNNDINTPHFIVMDEKLGYWFVTTIASGYIAQYSLIDNELIDSYFVGDAPAILAIDTNAQKIYCSRMMPMNGMGNMMPSSESNIIQVLGYSSMGMFESISSEYEIGSPAPHGLAINHDGTEIYTASNTTDWLYKINTITGDIAGVVMDASINNPPDQAIQRLKPIQCLSLGNRLFVSCSAGPWYNPFTGENSIIPGQLQLWDSDNMLLIDSIEFGDYTGPWHIKESPIDNIIYIALSGDNLYDTEGLAAVRFDNDTLELEWIVNDPSFVTLHGIDVSSDGQKIYVSGRGDGYIHVFDNSGNYLSNIYTGNMSMLGGICITKENVPNLGDTNNDSIINVVDIIKLINYILYGNMTMLSPYEFFASDLTVDNMVDISDILNIVNLIIE